MTTYTIKPLAWHHESGEFFAPTIFGHYSIVDAGSVFGRFQLSVERCGKLIIGHKDDIDEAKQACTEHWESMIRQALVPA